MKITILTLAFLFINQVFCKTTTSSKSNIDIELVAKLITERAAQKNFLVDTFQENILRKCDFTCKDGSKPIENPENIPNFNGCGSYNFNINFEKYNMTDFDRCCDVHDVCYEICNEQKKNCDSSFGRCLNNACERWATDQKWSLFQKLSCKTVVTTMETAVNTLGCTAYKNSQVKACTCPVKQK